MGFFSRKEKAKEKLQLLGFPGHVDTGKCLYLAAEKGLDIEYKLLDITSPEFETELRNVSPFGRFPCLYEGRRCYMGVMAILPLLDVKGGGQSLAPKKAALLGEQNLWIEAGQQKVLPALNCLLHEQIIGSMVDKNYSADQPEMDAAQDSLQFAFDSANQHLAGRNYFAGNFSLADVHWMGYLHYFLICSNEDFLAGYSNLLQWFARNKKRKVAGKNTFNVFPDLEQIQNKYLQQVA